MLRFVLGVLIILRVSQAYAVTEEEFPTVFPNQILPYYEQEGRSHFFTAKDGVKLHYRAFVKPGQEQALVIFPGRTEPTIKYAEVVWDLRDLNFAVYILDHRGQGASGRLVDDADQFFDAVIKPAGYSKVKGLAHSMGANIMSWFSIRHPGVLKSMVFSSPMLDIPAAPFFHEKIAYGVISFLSGIGLAKSYVYGQGPFDENETYRGTNSMVRYRAFHALRIARKQERVGGVSYRFVKEAIRATWYMRERAAELREPILLLQAGSDEVVLTGGQDYVCQQAKNCRKVAFPEARHEIHIEKDSIRQTWMSEARAFLAAP